MLYPALFSRRSVSTVLAAAFVFATLPALAAGAKPGAAYKVTNLVSDGSEDTPYTDPNMLNTWGVSFNPNGLVWVTNNRSGTSTLYDGLGVPNSLVVNVPPASGSGIGSPTGIVFSGTSDFMVSKAGVSGPSRFIFASNDGVITGWAPNVDLLNAIRAVTTPGANYLGLAVANSPTGARLYATDYAQGRVDMFDSAFKKIATPGAFVDPKLPKGLKPFGIQAINDQVYVTYIKAGGYGSGSSVQASGGSVQASGSGVDSVVSLFDSEGRYLRRAVARSDMREPWGIAIAPADFGKYSNRLLIGDFQDGTISAFDAATGKSLGRLSDGDGHELRIPGLWGFQFGNGINNQPLNTLFFGAGPHGQGGGVYGSVTVKAPR